MEHANSFSSLVEDILLREIKPRLDVTSQGMWRRTEKCLSCLFPAPRPTKRQWEMLYETHAYLKSSKFHPKMVPFMRVLDQAIHDDHVAKFTHEWPKFYRWVIGKKVDDHMRYHFVMHVMAVAVSAGSRRAFAIMREDVDRYHARPPPKRKLYSLSDLQNYAVSFGQVAFVCEIFDRSIEELYGLVIVDEKIKIDRYGAGKRHLITDLMCRRQWDFVTNVFRSYMDFVTNVFHYSMDIRLREKFELTLLQSSAAHGFIEALEAMQSKCDIHLLCYALTNATSVKGLRWFQDKCGHLFNAANHKKLVNSAKAALKRSHPKVLEWHVQQGFLQFTVIAPGLVDRARERGHTKTLRWIYTRITQQEEEGEERPKWFARKFRDLTFLKD
jgi:hypothetical protein